jgi:peroxiredoxin
VAQLRPYYVEIKSFNTDVFAISFGTQYWARVWLNETATPFTLLLDSERKAYQAYGLEKSLLRSWGLKNLWYYAKALLTGHQWYGIRGDSRQLGGDFIVDGGGIIRLAYRSRDPTDRPSVAQIITVLKQLNH